MVLQGVFRMMCDRISIAGLACLALSGSLFAAPGDLDLSFNTTGTFGPFSISNGEHSPQALALQPDGKIVVAGHCQKSDTNPDTDFCLLRLNGDGTLDASFTGPTGTASGAFMLPLGYPRENLAAVRIQSDGKIVLAGTCGSETVSQSGRGVFCVARLNPSGSFDDTFDGPPMTDGNGILDVSFGSGPTGDTLVDMVIQADGKIVLGGTCTPTSFARFCVARLNGNDGSYDANFDGPNAAGTGVGTGNGRFLVRVGTVSTDNEILGALALQADGGIVLGGLCVETMCMMRLLGSNGSFDTSFDGPSGLGNGRWAQNITNCPITGSGCQVRGIAEVQADGSTDLRLVIAIYVSQSGSPSYEVALLRPTASTDPNMTGSSANPARALMIYPFSDVTRLIEPAGARLVLGIGGNLAIARFTPHFGPGWGAERGVIRGVGAGVSFSVFAATQQLDGRVIVLGRGGGSTFVVQRLQGGPYDCSGDYDGDGMVRATVDSLIGTRLALGMTGASVIAGINFPAGATRTTWPAIRGYLIESCGMPLNQ